MFINANKETNCNIEYAFPTAQFPEIQKCPIGHLNDPE